jgi:hypothetical protein
MARYFFQVRHNQAIILDQRGVAPVDRIEFAKEETRWALPVRREPLIKATLGNDAVIVDGAHQIILEISLASSRKNDLAPLSELRAKGDT